MKKIILSLASLLGTTLAFSQDPCYIKYTYDASGNRIKREFICAKVDTTDGILAPPPPGKARLNHGQNNEAVQNNLVEIYPNPSTGLYTIKHQSPNINAQIQIFTQQGQIIYTATITEALYQVNLQEYPNGLYYFTLQYPDQKVVKKVIKQ